MLSALSCGKPVPAVADADSELALAVDQGGFGYRVAPGEAARLARELERASASVEELRGMGRAAREFARRFDAGTVLSKYRKVIEEVAREPRSDSHAAR